MKRVFITGIAGFIGFHLAKKLYGLGVEVCGIDAFTEFYSKSLKQKRAAILSQMGIKLYSKYIDENFCDLLNQHKCTHLIHLAAQPGIRHSLFDPTSCFDLNGTAFFHVLEACRKNPGVKLIYASSSSVYGEAQAKSKESDCTDHPTSLYAAMKKANEAMAHTYHYLHNISAIGLRFFTVYGAWGRPDMAYYIFTEKIDRDEPIELFNGGEMYRDFTHIDDILRGIIATLDLPSTYGIYNLGKGSTDPLISLVRAIEDGLGKKAQIIHKPKPLTDVLSTHADLTLSQKKLGYQPQVTLVDGMKDFVGWYMQTKSPASTH